MSYSLITYIIIVLLISIGIYTLFAKKYEYFFIIFYPILPNYFALEVSAGLPLLTASRIMILILILYLFILHPKINLNHFKKRPSKVFFFLGAYFLGRLISNLYYVFKLREAIKNIFGILLEELLLLLLLYLIFDSSQKIEKALKCWVYSSSIVFIMAIMESITGFNPSCYIYTVRRNLLNEQYVRLGLLRSEFTFGIPSFFATYCVILIPLILYFYEQNKEKRFLLILLLDTFALIHSGCRAQLFFIAFLLFLSWLFCDKEFKLHYLKVYPALLTTVLVIILVLCIMNERLNYYYVGTGKSLLNEVGFDFDLSQGAPSGVSGFGSNENGSSSRLEQLSGIPYTLSKNPLFGLGYGAQNRKEIYYYWRGKWQPFATYDVGYVAIIANEGLFGFLSYICLALSALFIPATAPKKFRKGSLLFFIGYMICLLANDLLLQPLWIMYALFLSYNFRSKEE